MVKGTRLIWVFLLVVEPYALFSQERPASVSFYWELGGLIYSGTTSTPVETVVKVIAASDHFDKTGRVRYYSGDVVAFVQSGLETCPAWGSGFNYAINADYAAQDDGFCPDITADTKILYGDLKVKVTWGGQSYQSIVFDYSPAGDATNPSYKYISPDCFVDFDVNALVFTKELQGGNPTGINQYVFTAPNDYDFSLYDYHWFGTVNVVDNVVIPAGRTLTIEPGTMVKVATGKKIQVYGTPIAEGTSSNPITFTRSGSSGDWDGIRFEDSSVDADCIIRYANIHYANTQAVYCNYANPKIWNNTITNGVYGIQAYNSSPSIKSNSISQFQYAGIKVEGSLAQPSIIDNNVSNGGSTSNGIRAWYLCQPSLYDNSLNNNKYGIYAYWYAAPELGPTSGNGKGLNQIKNNSSRGVYARSYSSPFMGSMDSGGNRVGGYNSIYDNVLYNLYSKFSSHIEAQWNYWKVLNKFYADATSSYEYSNYLSSEPAGSGSSQKAIPGDPVFQQVPVIVQPDTNSLDYLTFEAEQLWFAGLTEDAVRVNKILVRKFPKSLEARHALVKIVQLHRKDRIDGISNYLEAIIAHGWDQNLVAVALDMLVGVYSDDGDSQNAFKIASLIIQRYPDSESEHVALYSLFNLYRNWDLDNDKAAEVLSTMKDKYPGYEMTLFAQTEMGEEVDWSLIKEYGIDDEPLAKVLQVPENYSLAANYPNPFNPSTTLRFNLPEASHVNLVIYDLAGRELRRWAGQEQRGFVQVVWAGRDASGQAAPSGIYIYRLVAASIETGERFAASRKMLLLK